MPHVLHDVSVRLTTLEQRTQQLSEKLEANAHRYQNRTAELVEAIATVNQAVSRTNRALVAHPPKTQAEAVDELTTTLRSMKKAQTQERIRRNDLDKRIPKWAKLIRRQVSAVVRRLYMPDEVFSDVRTLNANRFQLHSQHEEDGIPTALFQRAGVTSRRFVEIGCGRSGGNAAMFVKELGWTGLMLDASKTAIKRQRSLYGHRPGMVSVCAKVTPETVNDILTEHGFDGEVDLFSIDIDSYEYWVLNNVEVCRPRVLVVEYNALFGPERAVTVPYKEFPADAPSLYRGASLAALEKAARSKGYRLVLCENEGCNAFFLRDDVIPELPGITPGEAFRPALVRQSIGDRIIGGDVEFFEVLSEKELPLVEV